LHRQSLDDPESFWGAVAATLEWSKPYDTLVGPGAGASDGPIPRWFIGGELNACHNCVDRHVEAGHGQDAALLYESPVTGASRLVTFAQLQELTAQCGGAMRALGVGKGDRVLIYMPNSVEAVVAMLACARIGAIHSVVFGGFAPRELAARIDDARPSLVIAASCGIEGKKVLPYQPMLTEAFALAKGGAVPVIYWQRAHCHADLGAEGNYDWETALGNASPAACEPMASTDPLYILYTSGTTGAPKGIVRDTAGYLVALAWSMKGIYNCAPGDTFWAASDVGWVVGHSYICYGPLLNRNASVIFEGKPIGTPDAGIFWRLIEQHKVKSFFTAPTAIRAIKQIDPKGELAKECRLDDLQAIYLAGERTDPDTLHWVKDLLGKPVIDHWWQTETGWAICASPAGIEQLEIKPGSTSVPMPGWDIACLGRDGQPVAAGQQGAIVARLPLPPGAAPTLWNADERYKAAYLSAFDGYYLSGDAGYLDADGHVFVMGRTDDVINVAGHRLSSAAMEEVLAAHPAVAECAVIGKADQLKGQLPVGFVVTKAGSGIAADQLAKELVAAVRRDIGPIAAFKTVHVVEKLPKTRSGKILRKTIRQIADGKEPQVPAAIEDMAVLDAFFDLFVTP